MATYKKSPVQAQLEKGAGGGGGMRQSPGGQFNIGGRPAGMNNYGGGTINHHGKAVKGSNLQYDFGNVARPDVRGPNPGQYKFPGGYMDMTPNYKKMGSLSLWDRARMIFNRGR